ncbi:helix-turn-helix domain-containing protein [Magnetospirillum sulfuroxidans]|uniref:AraC family transcriptional regulator n=1 Tax=Magnetospirillum sulfuroxidans TaxID=611300 RepID=A0ABS5I7K2_9PROT|nr:helix-turn-helix domain-containing protein [Magnetospirillum sulfuroxidans]MBR9970409.1 AraC family transcriptional regulator [Magnetospirillum sulfuroxidans]
MPAALLEAWSHQATQTAPIVIVPDGCRDLIRIAAPGQKPFFIVSPLADSCYYSECQAGTRFDGYRLRPGVSLNEAGLLGIVAHACDADATAILSLIDDFTHMDPRVTEALACLADGKAAPNSLSERSLERLLKHHTGRPPMFWRGLSRARRAAAALDGGDDLAALALLHGYYDQAHMNRAFRRWFATTPAALRINTALRATITQSGYG